LFERRLYYHIDWALLSAVLAPGASIVLETDRREPFPVPPPGLRLADERRYGDTRVLIYAAD